LLPTVLAEQLAHGSKEVELQPQQRVQAPEHGEGSAAAEPVVADKTPPASPLRCSTRG
jgi:hypothetical protein